MLDYDLLFSYEPFCLSADEKRLLHRQWLADLTYHHQKHCVLYDRLVSHFKSPAELPPALPVRLFKEYDLRSVENQEIARTMTSSGTTGQQVSRIYLDKATSARQSKVLSRIVTSFTGKQRLPMLIIDSRAVVKDRAMFSARGAGILGFSMIGRDVTYALDEEMQLDLDTVERFCSEHEKQPVLLFGFTSIIWLHFCEELKRIKRNIDLSGIMIHGGGWKKLADLAIDNNTFKQAIRDVCGIEGVYNYYGMIEQTGSISMECEYGHLHTSVFSDIDVLDPVTLTSVRGRKGVIRTTSLLPTSYPGHVLLTEDEGEILGEDDCPCGRKGIYFAVYGRIKGAEIRGCSDTYGH